MNTHLSQSYSTLVTRQDSDQDRAGGVPGETCNSPIPSKTAAIKPLFIKPGSHWEYGYCALFHGKMRDKLQNKGDFYTSVETEILIVMRKEVNSFKPPNALDY